MDIGLVVVQRFIVGQIADDLGLLCSSCWVEQLVVGDSLSE